MMCMSTVVLATAHVFFETHQGECRSTLGTRHGLSSRIEGGFPGRLVKSMFCGNQSVGVYTLEFILTICIPYMIHGISY